jgi:hypothetical protein
VPGVQPEPSARELVSGAVVVDATVVVVDATVVVVDATVVVVDATVVVVEAPVVVVEAPVVVVEAAVVVVVALSFDEQPAASATTPKPTTRRATRIIRLFRAKERKECVKRVSAITDGLHAVGGTEQIPLPSSAVHQNIPTIRHTSTSQDKNAFLDLR